MHSNLTLIRRALSVTVLEHNAFFCDAAPVRAVGPMRIDDYRTNPDGCAYVCRRLACIQSAFFAETARKPCEISVPPLPTP